MAISKKRDLMKQKLYSQTDVNRWMISYADLVTLLFAFFLVMYALSSLDVEKYHAFLGSTKLLLDNYSDKLLVKETDTKPVEGKINLAELKKQLDSVPNKPRTKANTKWLEIELKSGALFQSSSADVNSDAEKIIADLVKQLPKEDFYIAVEGYTDSQAINTARYASNWELSAARAATVVRLLAKQGIPVQRMSAIAYGDNYPIASNATATGRAKNRRVVIIVSKDKSVNRMLEPAHALLKNYQSEVNENPKVADKPTLPPGSYDEVPYLQTIRTESGGLKFTRGVKKTPKTQPK